MQETAHTDRQQGSPAAAGERVSFTLTEMMVVLFIMGIVLALVVGVSRYVMERAAKEETQTTQNIVMAAVEEYKRATGGYPDDSDDCAELMNALKDNATTASTIAKLPKDAWGGEDEELKDGFEQAMRYRKTGGFGGRPVIISAGPDGDFGDSDSEKKKDNIYSDR
jgi:prepilin-type N-terminal cleavage/methylation domain-containing protein